MADLQYASQEFTIAAGDTHSCLVSAPEGTVAIAGGFELQAYGMLVDASVPNLVGGQSQASGWVVVIRNPLSSSAAATVWGVFMNTETER